MKVLCLNGYFLLPDDFQGTDSDAIRLLAEYHETEGPRNPHRRTSQDSEGPNENVWNDFWDMAVVHETGRLSMALGISTHDLEQP